MPKIVPEYDFPPPEDAWSAGFLATIGRLQALANEFSFHCDALASHLELRPRKKGTLSVLDPSNVPIFEQLVAWLTSRVGLTPIRKLDPGALTAPRYRTRLRKAHLAHRRALAAAVGLRYAATHQRGRASLHQFAVETAKQLADADQLVATHAVILFCGGPPSPSQYAAYPLQLTQWSLRPLPAA